ncbi:4-hydroxybutyrate dehydrogenase [Parazoarcus communis]|uniref:4-hydroxybutyrate dehydrogenase n=1 Tax=Parazoarcus communis TaxID=41977 RepID=A0A2U8GS27_9RHOO|nr:iron-containing alcohol dehydrogenase [Parazoarcus communis]AWI76462.1 4-hydroxybutyrate dehydrogenase [Parazoarcus communis]
MAQIRYLNTMELEAGALRHLASGCASIGMRRPLLVTDAGVRAAGLVDRALKELGGVDNVAVFDATPSNPTEAAVREALAVARAHQCDGLIALGGGSSIDCAKGVSIAATHEGPLARYATIEGGSPLITERVWPLIAVPTTAGTGSEVARGAIVIVEDGRKLGFHSWHLMPRLAILDPDLTLGLPPSLTAATGMDAIAHCMEAFMAPAFNPPADGIALDGLERGWANIETATLEGGNVEARLQMMSASMQGGLAFQKGLGCVHSLSHSLGGVNPGLHHGTLNAMFLPAVIQFNAQAESVVRERRLERMAAAMGLGQMQSAEQAAHALGETIKAMNRQLGLPSGLAAMGVETGCFNRVIDGALADHCHKLNPRLASADDYRHMLHASM